jgi:hypothetical protein
MIILNLDTWSLDQNELVEYSEKFKSCEQFIKQHTTRDLKVVNFKRLNGIFTYQGKYINVNSNAFLKIL